MKYFLVLLPFLFLPFFVTASSVDDINAYRKANHLNEISESQQTCLLAKVRVLEIQTDWSHNGFYEIVHVFHIPGTWYEDLARDFKTPKDALTGWKNSPVHNTILLSPMRYGCVAESNGYFAFNGLQ